MKRLDWQVEKAGRWQVFVKRFLLIGSLIKIQRVSTPIPYGEIEKIAKKCRAFKTAMEFDYELQPACRQGRTTVYRKNYKINKSPFLPTKTIIIDLTKTEQEIFRSFTPEKQRAIRKAGKNGVLVRETKGPQPFIAIKQKSLLEKFILPLGSKKEILALWKTFAPRQAKILIAYFKEKPVAGVFLLFHEKMAYYWLAAAANKGKKLFAPSLLVWEALKLAKKSGCFEFDFEGIYDERFPIPSWKGFTKFKQGFGGKEIMLPEPLIRKIY